MHATTSSIGTRVGQWLAAAAAIASFTIGVAISSFASAYANPDPSAPAVVDVSTPPPADNSAPPSDEAAPPADNSAPPTGETEKEKEAEEHNLLWGPYGILNPTSPNNPGSPTNPNNWRY